MGKVIGLPLCFEAIDGKFEGDCHDLNDVNNDKTRVGAEVSSLTPALLIKRSNRDSCFMNASAPSLTLFRLCWSISSICRSSGFSLDAFICFMAVLSLSDERPVM